MTESELLSNPTETDQQAAKQWRAARYYDSTDEDIAELAQFRADGRKAERELIIERGLAFCDYLDTIHSSAGALARGFFLPAGEHRKER